MGEDELKTNHPGAGLRGGWYVKKQIMASKFPVSVERLELSTNGLKGHCSTIELHTHIPYFRRSAFYHALRRPSTLDGCL